MEASAGSDILQDQNISKLQNTELKEIASNKGTYTKEYDFVNLSKMFNSNSVNGRDRDREVVSPLIQFNPYSATKHKENGQRSKSGRIENNANVIHTKKNIVVKEIETGRPAIGYDQNKEFVSTVDSCKYDKAEISDDDTINWSPRTCTNSSPSSQFLTDDGFSQSSHRFGKVVAWKKEVINTDIK